MIDFHSSLQDASVKAKSPVVSNSLNLNGQNAPTPT